MQNEFVNYNQALALKELGFDEPCMASRDMNNDAGLIQIPLKQQAFRWFREKYPYRFYILPCSEHKKYLFEITLPSSIFYTSVEDEAYNTYEEAEGACLDKLIEICKNK